MDFRSLAWQLGHTTCCVCACVRSGRLSTSSAPIYPAEDCVAVGLDPAAHVSQQIELVLGIQSPTGQPNHTLVLSHSPKHTQTPLAWQSPPWAIINSLWSVHKQTLALSLLGSCHELAISVHSCVEVIAAGYLTASQEMA